MDVAQARAVLTMEDSQFQQATKRAAQSFDQMGKQVEATGKRVAGNVREAFSTIGTQMSLAVTAPLAALGAASIRSATQMDSLKRGLTAVAGSSAEAERQLKRLEEIAKLPGLGFEEAIQGSTQLQAAGLSAKMAERSLLAFGNALATVGKGKAELDGVTLALTQITSKGKITAEEINQIAERVPQIRVAMQAAFGTANTEALQKMGISAKEFIDKINTELLKLPRVTGGAQNAFENMGGAIRKALGTIGNELLPTILPMVERLTKGAVDLAEGFGKLPAPVRQGIIVFAALAATAGPVLLGMGQMATAIGAVKTILPGLKAAFIALPLPLKLIAAGLAALALAWKTDFLGIRTAVEKFGAWITPYLRGMWEVLKADWKNLLEGFKAGWAAIVDFFQSNIVAPLKAVGQSIVQALSPAFEFMADIGQQVGEWLSRVGEWAIEKIPGLKGIRDWFVSFGPLMERFRQIGLRAMAGDRAGAATPPPPTPGGEDPNYPRDPKGKSKQRADTPYEQQWKDYHQALNAANRELDLLSQNATDTAISVANQYSLIDGARQKTLVGKLQEIKEQRDVNQIWANYRQELRSAQVAMDMAAVSGDKLAELRQRFSRRDEQGRIVEQIVSDADLKRILEANAAIDKLQKTTQGWQQYNRLQFESEVFKAPKPSGAFIYSPAQRQAMQMFNKELKDLSENELRAGKNALTLTRLLNNNREIASRWEQDQQNLVSIQSRAAQSLYDAQRSFEAFAQGGEVGRIAMEQFGVSLKDMPTRAREAVTATIEQLIQIDQAHQMLQTFSDGVRNTFSDMFLSLQNGFGGFFSSLIDGFKQTLVQMAAEYLTSQLHRIVMEQLGGLVGSFFGGAAAGTPKGWHAPMALPGKAMGGYVGANKPVMVGEQGRELFLPRSSGTIIPNHQLAGAGGPNITIQMTIHTPDADSFRRNQRAIMAETVDTARRQSRRDGG